MGYTLTMSEFRAECEAYSGYCTACKDITRGECEPDAHDYLCPECHTYSVMGLEDAVIQGLVEVTDTTEGAPDA